MPEITTLRTLLSPTCKGDDIRLVGALFPRGYVSIIAGQPGCGKTWFELQYSLDVANGGACIGVENVNFPAGRVLILSGETSTEMLNRRAYQLGAMTDRVDNIIIYSLQALSEHNIDMSLTTSYGRKLFSHIIEEEQPDIVFVDSFISFMSGDESSQADISSSLVALNNLAKRFDIAIVIIHHYRKRQQGATSARGMDDVIGSSAITRLAGVVVAMEVDSMKSPPVVYVKCVKSWWKPFHTFTFSVCDIGGNVVLKQTYAVSLSGASSANVLRSKVEDYILSCNDRFTQRQVAEATETSVGLVNLVIGALCQRGAIRLMDKHGNEKLYAVVNSKLL